MGFKEELCEQGYSKSEIAKFIEEAQRSLKAEKRPRDIEGNKKELSETGKDIAELGKVDRVKESLSEYHTEYAEDKKNHQRAMGAIKETAKLEQAVSNIPELPRTAFNRE